MNSDQIQTLISMAVYMLFVIGIGVYFAKRANKNSAEYFLGGRSLGPWVAAMSAEASDMSGWLLMGLPGVAYWCGVADAAWTAIGLAVGTYINWLVVARRLRRYSVVAGDAITLPDFFSARFREKKKIIMTIAALFILIFFTVYAASCFVTCGKLFSGLFGTSYQAMMILGAVFVIIYTFLGGFLAESASDFVQAIVMIGALSVVLIVGTVRAGGIGAVIENAKQLRASGVSFLRQLLSSMQTVCRLWLTARRSSADPPPMGQCLSFPAWHGVSAILACRRCCFASWQSARRRNSNPLAALPRYGL